LRRTRVFPSSANINDASRKHPTCVLPSGLRLLSFGPRSLFDGHNVFPNHIAAGPAQEFDLERVLADKAVL
jgi:hypothetical protein